MQLTQLLDMAWEMQKELVESDDEMSPSHFYCESETGDILVIAVQYGSEREKTSLLNKLTALFRQKGICRYVMVSEAWMVSREKKEEIESGPPPSECDDRVDTLVACACDRDTGEQISRQAKIERKDGARRVQEGEPLGKAEGRMLNLFREQQRTEHTPVH